MADKYAALEAYAAAQPNGTTDAVILASYTATTITQHNDVPTPSWAGYMAQYGFIGPLEAYAGVSGSPPTGASATAIGMAKLVVLMITNPGTFPTIQLSQSQVMAEVTAGLNAFVAEGAASRLVSSMTSTAFAQSDMNNLLAIGTVTVSQATVDGWTSTPNENDLIAARDVNRGAYPHV